MQIDRELDRDGSFLTDNKTVKINIRSLNRKEAERPLYVDHAVLHGRTSFSNHE